MIEDYGNIIYRLLFYERFEYLYNENSDAIFTTTSAYTQTYI